MKKILYIFIVLIFNSYAVSAEEVKCDTALSKLNPKCNFVGKGMEKMRKFSQENKTLDQKCRLQTLCLPVYLRITTCIYILKFWDYS